MKHDKLALLPCASASCAVSTVLDLSAKAHVTECSTLRREFVDNLTQVDMCKSCRPTKADSTSIWKAGWCGPGLKRFDVPLRAQVTQF
eukprot:4430047-Amphidinium_carterae.1